MQASLHLCPFCLLSPQPSTCASRRELTWAERKQEKFKFFSAPETGCCHQGGNNYRESFFSPRAPLQNQFCCCSGCSSNSELAQSTGKLSWSLPRRTDCQISPCQETAMGWKPPLLQASAAPAHLEVSSEKVSPGRRLCPSLPLLPREDGKRIEHFNSLSWTYLSPIWAHVFLMGSEKNHFSNSGISIFVLSTSKFVVSIFIAFLLLIQIYKTRSCFKTKLPQFT